MISQIHIKNFKSIVDLTLELGRVNLFIGENGSGKSNLLEAVAFLSSINSIDEDGILFSKGVRETEAELFSSAFSDDIPNIDIDFIADNQLIKTSYKIEDPMFLNWKDISTLEKAEGFKNILKKYGKHIEYNPFNNPFNFTTDFDEPSSLIQDITFREDTSDELETQIITELEEYAYYHYYRYYNYLTKFVIYSPEVSALREFKEKWHVRPLGIHGEGLFSLLVSMSKDNGSLQHIKEHLELIDWYDDFIIPNDLMSNEYRISIKDRFIDSNLKYLDQRSANEGFLFLLFYIVLFSSKKTPQFFAIDNIEASFNPKLCAKLINTLVELAKKNDKQVLMTTHNPATLDGLNLNDPEQRLFVVERNLDGHTIVTRITEKPKIDKPMKLSEMWTKGYLGGLPENF